jgi:hypothetical protein
VALAWLSSVCVAASAETTHLASGGRQLSRHRLRRGRQGLLHDLLHHLLRLRLRLGLLRVGLRDGEGPSVRPLAGVVAGPCAGEYNAGKR